jgi:heme/copper-type cytochrome/quinol oxidase subunit 2
VSKNIKVTRGFRVREAGPRFLLFLKTRARGRSLEPPAKSSNVIEAWMLIILCLVLLAIAVLVWRVFHHQ